MFLRKSGKNHAKFVIFEENLAKITKDAFLQRGFIFTPKMQKLCKT